MSHYRDALLWTWDAYFKNQLSDWSDAITSAEMAVAIDKSFAPPHTELATALRDEDSAHAAEALAEVQHALALGGDGPRALFQLAALQSSMGDHPSAAQSLERALNLQVGKPPVLYLRQLGYEYLRIGNFPSAKLELDRAIARDPHDSLALRFRGDVADNTKDSRGAIGFYNRALKLSSGDEDAMRGRAAALDHLHEFRASEQAFAAIAKLDLKWAEPAYDRGLVFNELNQTALAREQFQEAVKRDKTWADAHYQLALSLSRPTDPSGMPTRTDQLARNRNSQPRLPLTPPELGTTATGATFVSLSVGARPTRSLTSKPVWAMTMTPGRTTTWASTASTRRASMSRARSRRSTGQLSSILGSPSSSVARPGSWPTAPRRTTRRPSRNLTARSRTIPTISTSISHEIEIVLDQNAQRPNAARGPALRILNESVAWARKSELAQAELGAPLSIRNSR